MLIIILRSETIINLFLRQQVKVSQSVINVYKHLKLQYRERKFTVCITFFLYKISR